MCFVFNVFSFFHISKNSLDLISSIKPQSGWYINEELSSGDFFQETQIDK